MTSSKTSQLRLAVLAATTLVVAACSGGRGDSGYTPPVNAAPTVTAIDDRSADQDTVLSIEFGISDRESGPADLTVTASVDGNAVFPADGVVLSGSGATRMLTLTPLEAATGTANVTIRVADPAGAAATRSFAVAVNARNASVRALALDTFAKSENGEPTMLNGLTIQQDADDPAAFAGLIPAEEP